MEEYFAKPVTAEGLLERAETNIKELMDSPSLHQDRRIAIRPVIEHSDLKLMSMTIQSGGSSIRSKTSRLVAHP
jgi:hypothetical protein